METNLNLTDLHAVEVSIRGGFERVKGVQISSRQKFHGCEKFGRENLGDEKTE